MIKCILVINNNGVVRLSRFYEAVHDPHDHQEPAQQEADPYAQMSWDN